MSVLPAWDQLDCIAGACDPHKNCTHGQQKRSKPKPTGSAYKRGINSYLLATCTPQAGALESQGKHGEAEVMFREVLEKQKKVLGPENPDTLTIANNLAYVLDSQGKYEDAEAVRTRSCASRTCTSPLCRYARALRVCVERCWPSSLATLTHGCGYCGVALLSHALVFVVS